MSATVTFYCDRCSSQWTNAEIPADSTYLQIIPASPPEGSGPIERHLCGACTGWLNDFFTERAPKLVIASPGIPDIDPTKFPRG